MFKLKEKQAAMLSAAQEFASGANIQEVMNKYNVSYASIYNAIKRYNIQYKYPGNRKIEFNTRYFQFINTEYKAYWLGFLFADGSISKTDKCMSQYNRVILSVAEEDSIIAERFAESIHMDQKYIQKRYVPQGYKPGYYLIINCNSVDMVNDLISHGYTTTKKERNHIPEIQNDLMNHFIRGYFDGDGSISTEFNITSEGYIIPLIYEILINNCHLSRTKISYTKNSYRIRWGGSEQINRIFNYLYQNATIYLERKFDKFNDRHFHV